MHLSSKFLTITLFTFILFNSLPLAEAEILLVTDQTLGPKGYEQCLQFLPYNHSSDEILNYSPPYNENNVLEINLNQDTSFRLPIFSYTRINLENSKGEKYWVIDLSLLNNVHVNLITEFFHYLKDIQIFGSTIQINKINTNNEIPVTNLSEFKTFLAKMSKEDYTLLKIFIHNIDIFLPDAHLSSLIPSFASFEEALTQR